MNDDELDRLEAEIPLLAERAFRKARETALAAGLSVLAVSDGDLIEVFPDGRRTFIKHIGKRVEVRPGEYKIMWKVPFPDKAANLDDHE